MYAIRSYYGPYLFSNTLAPVIASASCKVFEIVENGHKLRQNLRENSEYFRTKMSEAGFKLAVITSYSIHYTKLYENILR